MTNQQHPITPPPELVEKWAHMLEQHTDTEVFTQAARWGADCELDACCEWLVRNYNYPEAANPLRATRRPKPPSLKQRGLSALKATNLKKDDPLLYQEILNAIEGLPND